MVGADISQCDDWASDTHNTLTVDGQLTAVTAARAMQSNVDAALQPAVGQVAFGAG